MLIQAINTLELIEMFAQVETTALLTRIGVKKS